MPLIDREFWKHPQVWRLPPIYPVKTETHLPTVDFVAGAVNVGVNFVFFTLMHWESMTGIGRDNHFVWPFVASALIHAATIVDLGVFFGISDVVKSDAGVRRYVKEMTTGQPSDWPHVKALRVVVAKTVAPRLRGFARQVREVQLGHGQT